MTKFYKKPFIGKINNNSVKKPLSNSGGSLKSVEKKEEKKEEEEKIEKKLKGDYGYNCNYYNGHNHLAHDCMLIKQEEKKEKVKDGAYYAMKIEELREKSKNLSLVAKGSHGDDGTYQVWSSVSDEK